MRKFFPFLLLLLVSCVAAADTVTMTLVSVGPGIAGGPNSGGGVYVYPYYFSIDGSATTIPLICDDYIHDVSIGESWQATVTPLTSYLGALTPTVASGLNHTQAYQEAAYLFSKLSGTPSQADAVAYNFALWGLFSTAAVSNPTYASSGAAAKKLEADTAIDPISPAFLASLSNYVVYTPIAGSQPNGYDLPQEYLGMSSTLPHSPPPPDVPEPASLIMLGSGMMGVAGFIKRRTKK